MSTRSGVTVLALSCAQLRQGARRLAHAFADDPVLTACLDDPRRRALAYRLFFGEVLASQRRAGPRVRDTRRGPASPGRTVKRSHKTPSANGHRRSQRQPPHRLVAREAGRTVIPWESIIAVQYKRAVISGVGGYLQVSLRWWP